MLMLRRAAHSLARPFSSGPLPSTQDKAQLDLFNKLGGAWWHDPGLASLRNINRVRIPIFKEFLVPTHGDRHNAPSRLPLQGIRVLDVGCGGGFLAEGLAKLGANTTGLDTAADAIAAAREHASLDAALADILRYEAAPVEEWALKHPEHYDAVVCSEVIEHVNEPEYFLGRCLACLRPGGSMILTTMSQNWLGGFVNIFLSERITGIIPRNAHEYSKFIHPRRMQEMLLEQRCSTIEVKGFLINSFTAESVRVPVACFNYAIHAVKHR